ncbi:hypothetical protein KSF_107460 [Reticulibacter mediterranei]|uniref:Uncharacterized protein n=1 Tax=Reticulibacter mediterranei TaxID=2778369 RepID=A0A8J3IU83_9CHLR|nr:hypothetical protein KSF_107460 [Reticulibacter mediterranei]
MAAYAGMITTAEQNDFSLFFKKETNIFLLIEIKKQKENEMDWITALAPHNVGPSQQKSRKITTSY